ncbi:MAG TPA: hypothetical protein DCP71_08760 [Verrucomicrobiales bacterium]|nr:hypothetical protein [Verrucomicrobiales bacterium]
MEETPPPLGESHYPSSARAFCHALRDFFIPPPGPAFFLESGPSWPNKRAMFLRILTWIVCMVALAAPAHAFTLGGARHEAITFAAEPGKVYLPLNEAANRLRWGLERDDQGRATQLNGSPITPGSLRQLTDGTELVEVADLQRAGAPVKGPAKDGAYTVGKGWRRLVILPAAQRVEVSLPEQQLRGWQGQRLVLQTNISSGKNGATPAGEFTAGPYRAQMHRSSLYNNAPMPWSVQIRGHIFVHGYTSVPRYPASHGCVRMPLTGRNPAKFFYEWVQSGTPVSITK